MTAAKSAAAAVETPVEAPAQPAARQVPDQREKTKRQPPYAVVLHNDDYNGMDFVVGALRKVFRYSLVHAVKLMMKAHVSGQCIVWTGPLEVAELKADQLRSCGADPHMKQHGATSLSVTIEPLPE
jgi:ATP-dependent Clp protease adaptor protein ClpS